MKSRTAALLVMHNIDDEDSRESLAWLLVAAGKSVEIEWLDDLRAVARIGPQDLENSPTDEPNG